MWKCENHVFLIFFICVACSFKSVKNTDCVTTLLTGNEIQQVDLQNECSVYIYEKETLPNASISRIVLRNAPKHETSNATFANVIVEEYKSNEEKYVRANAWTINSYEPFKGSHFSEHVKMRITFKSAGNWTNSNVSLCYEVINFEKFERNTSHVNKNEISPWDKFDDDLHYRPNSNYIFHIDKNENLSSSNILITLNELDIDKDIGEYLLIGAGLQPFEGPPPLCITEVVGKKKYLVDDEAAYILFVTRATRRNYRGFNISWDYRGITIEKPVIDEKEDVKESAPICIYNITGAKEEVTFKKPEDYFKDFRENFAQVATNYRKDHKGNSFTSDDEIKASSISIFRISGKFKDDESNEALYAMVKITEDSTKGKAAFERHELEKIISLYSENAASGQIVDTFKFRKCRPRYVPESWFYFGLILLIPVVCFALLLWIWKQNPIAEHYEKKRRLKRASQHENSKYYVDNCDYAVQAIAENPYTSLPKVQVTSELGRRTTLNLSDILLCDDNASDDELFNKMYTNKRRSDVMELQRMKMTNRIFLTNEGEDNTAFELDEDNNAATGQRQQEDRAEHTYESVRSSASLCENTKL